MAGLVLDLRDAVRRLRNSAGLTTLAIGILAVGIGGTTAFSSIAYGVLLRPLPFDDPSALVKLRPQRPGMSGRAETFSEGEYIEFDNRTSTLDALAAYRPGRSLALVDGEVPVQVSGTEVTANLFPMLGVSPAVGRFFSADEDRPGATPVVIVGHRHWLTRYGGDPAVVGRAVRLDGRSHVIVGVAAPGFLFPDAATAIWTPLRLDRRAIDYQSGQNLQLVGRLAPRASMAQVADDLDRAAAQITEARRTRYAGMSARAVPLREDLVGDSRLMLLFLMGIVVLVLATVCFNLAGLFLARTLGRRRELAVRAALGAPAGRLVRQVVAEIGIITLAGAALGIWVADGLLALVTRGRPAFIPRIEELTLDSSVLGAAVLSATFAALLCGIGPALQVGRWGSETLLRDRASGSGLAIRHRTGLVIVQIAVSVMLLVGAGLMFRSWVRLSRIDLGFRPADVLTFKVTVPESTYPTGLDVYRFLQAVRQRVARLPGVEEVGATTILPMSGVRSVGFAWREDQVGRSDLLPVELDMRWVTPGYFESLGIPLSHGRRFDLRDFPGAPLSSVVSASLADQLWPDEDPIGRRFKLGRLVDATVPWRTVVGVVGDLRARGPQALPVPTAYFVNDQQLARRWSVAVRTARPLASMAEPLRATVAAVDPSRPVYAVTALEDLVRASMSMWRFSGVVIGAFAALVCVIACLGLYGLIAYSVRLRARELTLRMVFGAEPRRLVRLVVGNLLWLLGAGAVVGVSAALVMGRLIDSLLFGVESHDALSIGGALAMVAVSSVVSGWIPARRAARLAPGILWQD